MSEPDPTPPANPPTTPPAAPTFTPDLPENWFLAGGDAFAAEAPTLSRFKSVTDLAKSFIHLRKTGPSYPTEQSLPEDVERFRALAHVPADPTGYGLANPATLPQGYEFDLAATNALAEVAHKHHVPKPALQALAAAQRDMEIKRAADASAAAAAEIQRIDAEIQTALGKDELERARNAAQVNHLVKTLADQADIDPNHPGLEAFGKNPAAVRILLEMAKLTREDSTRAPAGFGDLASDREKAERIMTGRDPEWSSRYKEGDKAAVERVMRLLSSGK